MAMLLLPDVFERTWGRSIEPFWPDASAGPASSTLGSRSWPRCTGTARTTRSSRASTPPRTSGSTTVWSATPSAYGRNTQLAVVVGRWLRRASLLRASETGCAAAVSSLRQTSITAAAMHRSCPSDERLEGHRRPPVLPSPRLLVAIYSSSSAPTYSPWSFHSRPCPMTPADSARLAATAIYRQLTSPRFEALHRRDADR